VKWGIPWFILAEHSPLSPSSSG